MSTAPAYRIEVSDRHGMGYIQIFPTLAEATAEILLLAEHAPQVESVSLIADGEVVVAGTIGDVVSVLDAGDPLL